MENEDDPWTYEWLKYELPEDLKFWFEWLKYELPEDELRKLFEPHTKPGPRGRPPNSLTEQTKRILAIYERMGSPELSSQVKDDIASEVFSAKFSKAKPGSKRRNNIREIIRKALFRLHKSERT